MAFTATAVGRVRVSGNDANGAWYDAGIAGAGTDYSQQDAAQLSVTDIACSNTTTVTSATGGFTAAMIGNAVRITGGGATSGYYFITARASTNSVTVDRAPGTVSGGTGKVGGAAASVDRLWNSASAAGDKAVPGNTVYLRGAGTDTPSSADYTLGAYFTPVPGDTTGGMVRLVGENGRPRISCPGLGFYSCSNVWFENLYVAASSAANGANGVASLNGGSTLYNCVIDLASNAMLAAVLTDGAAVIGCELFGSTAKPTRSAGNHLISVGNYGCNVTGNHIYYSYDSGVCEISSSAAGSVHDNVIHDCAGDGVGLATTVSVAGSVCGNTIHNNSLNGVTLSATAVTGWSKVWNNEVTSNGVYGIEVATGSTALNDRTKRFLDYNNVWNNGTSAYHNVSAGTHDTAVDPQYVSTATKDYTPANVLTRVAFPSSWRDSPASATGRWAGAVQPTPSAGTSAVAVSVTCPVQITPYRTSAYG